MNGSIVVTGAARGIGRAIAERLAANPSFTVIGVDLAPELALVESLTPVQVDLTTYRRLHTRFRFDTPHDVEIKGKGRMQVFHLLERQ